MFRTNICFPFWKRGISTLNTYFLYLPIIIFTQIFIYSFNSNCNSISYPNAVIINKIITKAFLDFNDDIKCDHELVKAFEEVLETLVGFGMEEAAVILDEFRVH